MTNALVFNGFKPATVQFYSQLRENNNKSWFEAHKTVYQDDVMTPAREFVMALGSRLQQLSPGVHADPRVNKSIFRINRDVRFSHDKSPYKTNLGLWFWEGLGPRMECSGFYFQLEPPNLMLATGLYMFTKDTIKAYRDSVVDNVYGTDLHEAVTQVTQQGKYSLGGKHYKRVPRGYDPEHPNANLLLYNGLHVGYETAIPQVLYSPDLVEYCFQAYQDMYPIHRWLLEMTNRV